MTRGRAFGRSGIAVLEVLLAIVLGASLTAAAVSLLRAAAVAGMRATHRSRVESVVEEALGVTVALVGGSAQVVVDGDTAVTLERAVLDALPCGDGSVVVLSDDAVAAPLPDDRWSILARLADSVVWRPSPALSVRDPAVACPLPDSTRLLARVTRRVRVVPYRSSDGTWMLGLRTCVTECGPAQPLAGPIRPPVEEGWRVRAVACGIDVGVWAVGARAPRWRLASQC